MKEVSVSVETAQSFDSLTLATAEEAKARAKAKVNETTRAHWKEFLTWAAERPAIEGTILRYPPGLYWLRTSGHVVNLYSYDEPLDGGAVTFKVNVLQELNPHVMLAFERTVFGILEEDLEPLSVLSEPKGIVQSI